MIVYVDVLVALNFVVNYLLLLVSARLGGFRLNRIRIALAALVGAAASLLLFLPPLPPAANVALKGTLSALLALIAGGYKDWRSYLKRLLFLLAASFVFAGLLLFLTLLTGGKAGFYQNGVYYYNLSAVELLGGAVAAYAVLLLYQKLFKRSMAGEGEYRVLITMKGKTKELRGVMDSQNHLIDLFSGTPVVIGSAELLGELLPENVEAALSTSNPESLRGLRLIPLRTVAGQDVLPAFRPDGMVLWREGRRIEVEDVYIAVASENGSAGMRKLILNPAMVGRETMKLHEGGV